MLDIGDPNKNSDDLSNWVQMLMDKAICGTFSEKGKNIWKDYLSK